MSVVSGILKTLSGVRNWFFKRSPLINVVLIITILGIGWFTYSRIVAGRQQPQFQTTKVERGTIISTISASGSVMATNTVSVTTQASGVVKAVYVKDGEKVVAGQKIIEITLDQEGQQKNASAWASYLAAKNNLESAKATLYTLDSAMWAANQKFINDAVARGLSTDDPTYIQQHDDWLAAEAKYKNQKSVIDQAKASLNSAWLSYQSTSPIVTAPIAGVVSNLGVVPGMILNPQNTSTNQTPSSRVAVIRTQSETRPIISVNIAEVDVPKVKIDQKVTVTLDSLPDKTFTGKVVTVDRIGTSSNNVVSYPALIQLDTFSSEILPNMAANASIILESKSDVLLVPSAAVQTQAGQSFVRVLRNGHEEQVLVEIGLQSDTQVEIISGLSEGDEVIIGVATNQTQQRRTSIFGGGTFRQGGGFIFRR
ncbi:MAG: efflux RND transporter periplasmic adaptor subunit [Candidatus Anstonellales archaeon]